MQWIYHYNKIVKKRSTYCTSSQIVDKLDENINWAIPNWYFHFFMLKYSYIHSKY